MLNAITLLLCCQLAGEFLVAYFGLPLPGPVAGMVFLFAILAIRGGVGEDLARTGEGLLSHLSLLFVPAGVGVTAHLALLERDWLPISVALIVSTLAAIAVTAGLMVLLVRRGGQAQEGGAEDE